MVTSPRHCHGQAFAAVVLANKMLAISAIFFMANLRNVRSERDASCEPGDTRDIAAPTVTAKTLRALFVAYIVATVVHVGWVVAHEPFSFDAWNMAVDTSAKPFSVGRFLDYW